MSLDIEKSKLKCVNCNFIPRKKTGSIVFKENVTLSKDQDIEIRSKKIETLPQVKEECTKCGCKHAYYWTLQTRAADESETRFFECTKCTHRWRAYD